MEKSTTFLSQPIYGIYYSKDKFEELGLKVPETWDEFEQLVKDIVAKDKHHLELQVQMLGRSMGIIN